MAGDFSTNIAVGASTAIDALDKQQTHGSGKTAGAAKDFEALLIGQMLRSMHDEGGWLGTGEDQAGEAAVGLGEEQLARTLAASGGLGLSRLIESGIRKEEAQNNSTQTATDAASVTQSSTLLQTANQAKTTAPAISAPR